ncbi:hypothetical protein ACWEOO_06635 [Kribbella sp. NPDC004138]
MSTYEIDTAIEGVLNLPVAPEQFVGRFISVDMSASSAVTRDLLGWRLTGPTLDADIAAGAYG